MFDKFLPHIILIFRFIMECHLQNGTQESIWNDVFFIYQHQNRKSVNGSSQGSQRYALFILSSDIR